MKYNKFLITLLLLNPITIQNLQAESEDNEWDNIDSIETAPTSQENTRLKEERDQSLATRGLNLLTKELNKVSNSSNKNNLMKKLNEHATTPENDDLRLDSNNRQKWKSLDQSDQDELINQWKFDNTKTRDRSLEQSEKQYKNELETIKNTIQSSAKKQIKQYENNIIANITKITDLNQTLLKGKGRLFKTELTTAEKTETEATIETLTADNKDFEEKITDERTKISDAQAGAEQRFKTRNATIQTNYLEKFKNFQKTLENLEEFSNVEPDEKDTKAAADSTKNEPEQNNTEEELDRNIDSNFIKLTNIKFEREKILNALLTNKRHESRKLYTTISDEYKKQIEFIQTLINEAVRNANKDRDDLILNKSLDDDQKDSIRSTLMLQIPYLKSMQIKLNDIQQESYKRS